MAKDSDRPLWWAFPNVTTPSRLAHCGICQVAILADNPLVANLYSQFSSPEATPVQTSHRKIGEILIGIQKVCTSRHPILAIGIAMVNDIDCRQCSAPICKFATHRIKPNDYVLLAHTKRQIAHKNSGAIGGTRLIRVHLYRWEHCPDSVPRRFAPGLCRNSPVHILTALNWHCGPGA